MADYSWAFSFETEAATASRLVSNQERSTFRDAAAVDPTPVFVFDDVAPYQTVRKYVRAATAATITTGRVGQNEPYYRERPPSGISSFVVEVTPGADVGSPDPFWAVVQGGSEASSVSGARHALEVDLFKLADASAYADHAAVKTAFGSEVV